MKKFSVGIDLGTTNCCLAYSLIDSQSTDVELLPVNQYISSDMMEDRDLLPSFIYFASPFEQPSTNFPGVFARDSGASTPDKVAHSAKSWLSATGVDRLEPLLPWQSDSVESKLSPVQASAFYLSYLKDSWNSFWKDRGQSYPLSEQVVTITVPASFDAAARELTAMAAKEAGLENSYLLEEPLAAFYAWLNHYKSSWRNRLRHRRLVLIADIGGGTSDFTLVAIEEQNGVLTPRRVAVGDHLLAGGDNIDRAIAYLAEQKAFGKVNSMSPTAFARLTALSRKAKEVLLGNDCTEDTIKITLQGKGTSLVGSTKSIVITKAEVSDLVLSSFFPHETSFNNDKTKGGSNSPGLIEIGLPYARNGAVTTNLITFLKNHSAVPDAILFNGGTMRPSILRDRTISTIENYLNLTTGGLKDLTYDDLDYAVAKGASRYGLARMGNGIKVEANTSHSYYIGLAQKASEEDLAVCIIPSGAQGGEKFILNSLNLKLLINTPVKFSLYSSTTRFDDYPGATVNIDSANLTSLPPLQTVIRPDSQGSSQLHMKKKSKTSKNRKKRIEEMVDVELEAQVQELGTLDLYCLSRGEVQKRHKISFELRQGTQKTRSTDPSLMNKTLSGNKVADIAAETIEIDSRRLHNIENTISITFAKESSDRSIVKQYRPLKLLKNIEKACGTKRKNWSGALCRHIFGLIFEVKDLRRRTAETEEAWLNLAGYTLRPGFGAPNDQWRMENMTQLLKDKIQHRKIPAVRIAWWIMWRRICGGLNSSIQTQLFNTCGAHLLPGMKHLKKGPHADNQELTEIWRLGSSLERISSQYKIALGEQLIRRVNKPKDEDLVMWALSRVGGRVPFGDTGQFIIPPAAVEPWIEVLLNKSLVDKVITTNPLLSLSRKSGVPGLDIRSSLTESVARALSKQGVDESRIMTLRESILSDSSEQSKQFGESLPEGLILSQ